MFSTEIDRVRTPFRSRAWGIALGTQLLITVIAALISARTVPFLFPVTIAAFIGAAMIRGNYSYIWPRASSGLWHLLVFFAYAALTAAWSAEPVTDFFIVVSTLLCMLGSISIVQLCEIETRENVLHLGEGLWVGLMIAVIYLLAEILTKQSIKIWLYNAIGIHEGQLAPANYFTWSNNKLIAIERDDLARNIAALALFLWPALLAMRGTLRVARSTILAIGMWVLAGTVIMLASHETSKLAFVGSIAAFIAARYAPRFTGHFVAVAWVIACLGVLPSALLAYRYNLHNASWLQGTAQHRIIIWNFTAQEVLKAPWLGVGARTTYVLGPRLEPEVVTRPGEAFRRTLSTHSHSIYLQTWFELGLIGATLLTLLGLSILQAIRALSGELKPYAYATFATTALMAASSYGMWQIWFACLFGMCLALFGLAAATVRTQSVPQA
jgi:O-antigen ligase